MTPEELAKYPKKFRDYVTSLQHKIMSLTDRLYNLTEPADENTLISFSMDGFEKFALSKYSTIHFNLPAFNGSLHHSHNSGSGKDGYLVIYGNDALTVYPRASNSILLGTK